MERKKPILVIDDEQENIALLSRILSSKGYSVTGTTQPLEAVETACQASPCLILLDINMPQMDGFQVCRSLKLEPKTAEIPVLFLSGRTEESDKAKAFEAGAVDYITKPVMPSEVRARVSTHLALRNSQLQLQKLNRELEERVEQKTAALIQADKMISLGILVSGIAHEINNPNHFIMSHITPLKKGWHGVLPILDKYFETHGDFKAGGLNYSVLREKLPEIIANIQGGAQRIKTIVDELRDYARERPADFTTTVQINNVVKSALILLGNLLKRSTNNLKVEYGADIPPVKADYHRLEQVMVNLLQNACQALPDKEAGIGIITRLNRERQMVEIEVKDQGSGIAPDHLKHITDPFFTTKRDIGGTGLGLSISASIVAEHGGSLEIEPGPDSGTRALVLLPCRLKKHHGRQNNA